MNAIKRSYLVLVLLTAICGSAPAQWVKQAVDTTASFRGLSVVNEKIIWASGTGGTVIRTIDGGAHWNVIKVPDAAKLDFRDIEAFDLNTAYILSIGNGENSRIYKTVDGGNTWKLQFKNANETAFFDAIACWDRNNCIAMSDPVDNKFVLINTTDGGENWKQMDTSKMPATNNGEAAFAASGTCLITQGRNTAFIISGGKGARSFRTNDRGKTWAVTLTTVASGTAGSGNFSIAMFDAKKGVVVGGDYEKPELSSNNLAFTTDAGSSWIPGTGLRGYRSGVAYADKLTIVAVGSSGSDISYDGGKTWDLIGKENLNSVQTDRHHMIWAVGPSGVVVRKYFGTITLD